MPKRFRTPGRLRELNEMKHQAAIVCPHAASRELPILRARKDHPLDDADSGWQFLCYSGIDENEDDAQVWAIDSVLRLEPSLRPFLDMPAGTVLERSTGGSTWNVIDSPMDEE